MYAHTKNQEEQQKTTEDKKDKNKEN